jgi:CheY-like chemotaxis protein
MEKINGPIIIVEDDVDDRELYAECLHSIGINNKIRFFNTCMEALDYLRTTSEQPFIILSDINLPVMNGLQFKEEIQADRSLREKGIPFVFVSTNASPVFVRKAHELSVQGYFLKPTSYDIMVQMFRTLFTYWALCKHINNT